MSTTSVVLVDEMDREVGEMEKLLAHKRGELHRAFSVLLYNSKGEMLIQKRAEGKYHSSSLWSNACCSHPKPGESLSEAVNRRLQEELGIKCFTEFLFSFQYRIEFENGLIENELDHVFIGSNIEDPTINEQEVSEIKYVSMKWLNNEIQNKPEEFTYWFRLIISKMKGKKTVESLNKLM